MKTIGNVLWFLLVGIGSWLSWLLLGIVWCITIIGIPFGKQCFKFAALSAFPFGKEAQTHFGKHAIANVIWVIFGGLELFLAYLLAGVVFCISIIGIPFGLQCFKLSKLSLAPFGATVK
ncbi:MAG: YccF domain-containing protein [Clostridia bacterium]|nr:YccF domain-containing protein [Clostridia bacterium]